MKVTTNKAVTTLMLIMLIPFLLFATCTFFYIRNNVEENFISTITRINENTAQGSVEHQVSEIKSIVQFLASSIDGDNIDKYISFKHDEINTIIPSLVNSTVFFKGAIISDLNGRFRSYPNMIEQSTYNPIDRPWYPKYGIKDELYFSLPYISVAKDVHNSEANKSIAVSMNIFDNVGELKGNVALKLDLVRMSEILQHKVIPYNGVFEVVTRDGSIIMHSDPSEIFINTIPLSWIKRAIRPSGYFIDENTKEYVFYRRYNNPGWIAFTVISQDAHNEIFNASFLLFFSAIATCIVIYLIIMLLCRIYFKQLLHMLFMNIHGIDVSKESTTLESLTNSMLQKNKEIQIAENISLTDSLTGLGTRRKFDRDIENIIENNNSFHLAMIDLDNFKSINDTYGHHTGDLVLKFVSQSGLESLEHFATLYRFGGEEIAVIFPGGSYAEIYYHLDQWRLKVNNRKWREKQFYTSFSCGLATWQAGETPQQILEKADKLLYAAKQKGKNCIVGIEG
ncbi:diguanylate cyclase domain-containing protein [Buttiauxella noackiae]|uniref:sensor domain-containing diguanylate cyclase n=1 Tax=Buttiauxella noackiae TaxID=82992 RepID=UPI0028D67081|nr:diguanylate cyclase [Buttiauxella noackiae]